MAERTGDTQNLVDEMGNIIGREAVELSQQPTTQDLLENINRIISHDATLQTTVHNSNLDNKTISHTIEHNSDVGQVELPNLGNTNTSNSKADGKVLDKSTTHDKTLIPERLETSTNNRNDSSSEIKSPIDTNTLINTCQLSTSESHKRHIEDEAFESSKVQKISVDNTTESKGITCSIDNKTEFSPTLSGQLIPQIETLETVKTELHCDLLISQTQHTVSDTHMVNEDTAVKSKIDESTVKSNNEDSVKLVEKENDDNIVKSKNDESIVKSNDDDNIVKLKNEDSVELVERENEQNMKSVNEETKELEEKKLALLLAMGCSSSYAETIVTESKHLSQELSDAEKHDETEELWDRYFTEESFSSEPLRVTGACTEYEHMEENYLRGCKWSPDGTCILTNSNDNCLRIFNLPGEVYLDAEHPSIPDMQSVVKMKEGEMIYDFCWFPRMDSTDPATCCLASTSRDTPIHLWDAFNGELRCSYRAFNHVDEVVAAHCIAFSLDGTKLYSGFNKMIRVFDVSKPGRECQSRPTYKKQGQSGIISCIVQSPSESGVYAAGSYSRAVALYEERSADLICMFKGQQGGVTHLLFSPDGTKLYSGGRKDPEILCWDLRNPGDILFVALRQVVTNQRVYFDLDRSGRFLASGNNDGRVTVWDTSQTAEIAFSNADPILPPTLTFPAHSDAVNGMSIHPSLQLLATTSGQRHYSFPGDSDESDNESVDTDSNNGDNSLRIWSFEK